MKPDHLCVNHPTEEALSFCHYCNDWLCSHCVVEGDHYYHCRKPECLEALNVEEALDKGKCPFCRETITPGAIHCDSCGKKLRELTDEEKAENLITVARYNNSMEAHLARTKLESEDIEAFIADEHMVSINPGINIAFGGVKLQIKKSDVERAMHVLNIKPLLKPEQTLEKTPEEVPKEEVADVLIVKCPKCGQENKMKKNTRFCGNCSGPLLLLFLIFVFSILSSTLSAKNAEPTPGEIIFLKGNKAFKNKNYDEAFKDYSKASELGNSRAECGMGLCYEKGLGVPKNEVEARKWFQKSSDQGNVRSEIELGFMYDDGLGGPKDYEKARILFQKASNQGDPKAEVKLGYMYFEGSGGPKDYSKAVVLFQKASNQGLALGTSGLGFMYEHGFGFKKDYGKAMERYMKAAEKNDPFAQLCIGDLYSHGLGVTENFSQAAEWYLKAAKQGVARAQDLMGYLYWKGEGVPKDYSKALEWYQKASNQNYTPAHYDLGLMYYYGHGVPGDYIKARELFLKGANAGDSYSQYGLGMIYKYGYGVNQDSKEATKWFKMAKRNGNKNAEKALDNQNMFKGWDPINVLETLLGKGN